MPSMVVDKRFIAIPVSEEDFTFGDISGETSVHKDISGKKYVIAPKSFLKNFCIVWEGEMLCFVDKDNILAEVEDGDANAAI